MPTPEELEAEKARKKAEKEARRAQFAAANPDKKTTYEKPSAKNKANNNTNGQEQQASSSSTNTTTTAAPQPAPSSTTTTTTGSTDTTAVMDEAARKKAEKEARRAQFAAANPDKKTTYEKNAGAAKSTNTNKQQQQQQSTGTTATATAATQPPSTTAATTTTAPPPAPVKIPAYAQPEPISHLRQLCYPTPLGLGNRTAKNPFPKFTSSSSHNTNNASPAMSNTPTPSGPSSPSLMLSSNNNNNKASSSSSSPKANIAESPVHPRVAALGALLSARCVVGCNARLLATLEALSAAGCSFIDDGGHDLSDMTFSLKLTEYLRTNIQFLESCRPFSSGMRQITDRILLHVPKDIKDSKVVKMLFDEHREELQESIVDTAAGTARLIQEGDIVLTYGRSSSIEMALCSLCRDPQAPNFSIIIVDAAPHFEGRALLQRLREAGATALSYCMLDAVTTATHKATKVLLGASAMLPNGQVLGRAGTALVSIAAKYTRTPVFCVCESYKFTANMWQGSSSGFRVAASASQEEEKRMNEEKMLGLDLSGCVNTPSTVQQHCVGPVNYFGGTVLVANSNNNNSCNNNNSSGNPFSPVTQQQHGRFIGGGAGGAVQYSSTKARNAANNNSNSNKSISEEFSSVDLSYDLSPPGCVNFVVSEHEVHEPTAIAAVVSMRRG